MKILKLAAIALMTAVLSVPAYSQGGSPGRGMERKDEPKVDTAKRKAEDKLYNDSLSRIPPKEYDPWASVREKEKAPAEKPGPQKKTVR